ncbi:MAG: sigma-54-dependent Fis family transcriptional regulator [Calditrichaeota bacterium]|nr:MAG: sigma-54-dependent Fis family transcriptional regulator [Calditrichota bacterium]
MRILIIDDEDLFREDLATVLQEAGYECSTAATAEEGVEVATRQLPEVILCDIVMPGKSGIDILEELLSINPECAIIIMTAFGTLDTAIEAFRKGALDYLLKPLVIEDLLNKLKRIREHRQLRQEIQYLRRHVTEDARSLSLVGKSRPMQEVLELVKKVAPTQSTVLITGESGTGKEVVARAIHEFSEQRDRPFVAINCAGLQETLLESELFGHVKGAFTGAVRDKEGLFEVAGKGTVLLDEISEMPLALQSKLLRVLEQREFFRVGGTRPIPMQARIIAATNKDLKALVEAEAFREDLYFRIAVFEIPLPPLRERRSDIPLLVDYFVRKFNEEMKRQYRGASAEAIQAMMAYDWPGNIRELRNVVERAMILCNGEYITPEGLPQQITGLSPIASPAHNLKEAVHAFERTFIVQVLQSCGWNKEEAARRLQINPSTLYRKMTELGIEDPTSRKT